MLDVRVDHDPQRRLLQVLELRQYLGLRLIVRALFIRRSVRQFRRTSATVRLKPDTTYQWKRQ